MAGNPALNTGAFGLDARTLVVRDPNGVASDQIIDSGDPFGVDVTVEFDGQLAAWILDAIGSFQIRYRYQEMAGAAGDLGTTTVVVVPGQLTYDGVATHLPVAAGHVPAGLYRLAAEIDFGTAPVSAFTNGTDLKVR